MYNWPLSVSTFTLWDKIKIAKWVLTTDRFTMSSQVEKFEKKMSELSGMNALAVSSGSTANQLVFEIWKYKNPNVTPVVIVPAVTWISSITPAMMAGMDIEFCDINLVDFCFDYNKLVESCEKHKNRKIIIWPTALIGFIPHFTKLHSIAAQYKADLFLDSCENTMSRINGKSILSQVDISTTSTYFSHQIVSVEGGFVFFKNPNDYQLGRMFRNHGMTRSLPEGKKQEWENRYPSVDKQFLFALPGTNLRQSDVHATFGLIDMEKVYKTESYKKQLRQVYLNKIDYAKYYVPFYSDEDTPFCLPIFCADIGRVKKVKDLLALENIEYRPIIGGCLLNQPVFEKYGNCADFQNANWVNNHGLYIGLHKNVTLKMVNDLVKKLNIL